MLSVPLARVSVLAFRLIPPPGPDADKRGKPFSGRDFFEAHKSKWP
jgi:hypothetical protein